jgi:micrococcal nuclease
MMFVGPLSRAAYKVVISVVVLSIVSLSYAWEGKVTGVSDGDTITVLHNNKQEKIRLYGIDTPETQQYYGQNAKQFLASQVFDKTVDVTTKERDRYGRTVGIISVRGVNINRLLVEYGYAWVYDRYCGESFCDEWKQLEGKASQDKRGLWATSRAIPPWKYRHRRGISETATRADSTSEGHTGAYHGNTSSHTFHSQGCRYYDCKNCTAVFKDKADALAAGYKPCNICNP